MNTYKVTFTDDYTEYEKWGKDGDYYWMEKVKSNPDQLAMCKKWKDKTITLDQLPAFVEECGQVILSQDTVEVYNGYKE